MIKQLFASTLLASYVAADARIGVNIGGWMVLEPWITPSLFYRFLGKTYDEGVATDSYTFCEVLGAEEGNKIMRAHWDAWITEDLISQLADREVELVRLPIGDWTTTAYGPYIGCMDGASDYIQWFLDTAETYGLKVLLDVHAIKDSQNGFDNSGQAMNVNWVNQTNYIHWSNQTANWMGQYNSTSHSYDYINEDNIQWAVDNISALMELWGNHPALYAVEPVNEPWQWSHISTLKSYYRTTRDIVRDTNPDLIFVFHDAFLQLDGPVWNDLFDDDDMDNVVMDIHQYMAWDPRVNLLSFYCNSYKATIAAVTSTIKYPVWVGEWSLATDACATWLDGLNDSKVNPQHPCEWVDCPYSYLNSTYAVDFDRTAEKLSPWGENDQFAVSYGQCTSDSTYFDDDKVSQLGVCMNEAFDNNGIDAQFLWTARNEIEARWNYITAYDNGWLKTYNTTTKASVTIE